MLRRNMSERDAALATGYDRRHVRACVVILREHWPELREIADVEEKVASIKIAYGAQYTLRVRLQLSTARHMRLQGREYWRARPATRVVLAARAPSAKRPASVHLDCHRKLPLRYPESK